jgi:hypothetical protein
MSHNISFPSSFILITKAVFAFLFMFLITACEEEIEEPVRPENKLVAHAGPDQSVLINTEVLLDGSASKDGNGGSFAFAWTIKTKPSGSNVSIIDANEAKSSFVPDKTGVYTINLKISSKDFYAADDLYVIVTKTDDPDEPQTILISENIVEDAILQDIFTDPTQPDYLVTGDIQVSAILEVEPGVVIEFEQDKSMQIMLGGALVAEGSEGQPITFTGTEKQAGHWKGLMFATNNSLNRLHYCVVEYGGSSELPESPRTNISVPGDAISGSVLNLTNSTIRYSAGTGLYVGGASYLADFSSMHFADNDGSAIYCSPRNVSRIASSTLFTGNGLNGIETGGTLNEGPLVSWYPLTNGTLVISSDLTISSALEIVNGSTLKIAPNVLITVAADGTLVANGTAGSTITLEGTSTVTSNAWKGILFRSNVDNSLEHVIVRNAGSAELPGTPSIKASIAVAAGAKVSITNTLLDKSTAWGIALEKFSYYNEDIHTANNFIAMAQGSVNFPQQPQPVNVSGEWVDEYSFTTKNYTINTNFYNRETGVWFEGAENPWTMSPKTGFGLKIDEAGNYTWIIAVQHSPMTECFTYSAEHFTGHVTADGENMNFVEESWRSKYFNSCAPEENMDFEVQPGGMSLPYKVEKEYNMFTGEEYWVLTITSGGETFRLYKK